jgi:phenylacetate-CoA ligase
MIFGCTFMQLALPRKRNDDSGTECFILTTTILFSTISFSPAPPVSMRPITPHSSFAGAVWPAIPSPPAAALLSILHQLDQTERLSEAEIEEARRPQLIGLISHACRNSAFWKGRFDAAGINRLIESGQPINACEWSERWLSLPIITRPEVQDLGEDLVFRDLPKGHGNIAEVVTSGSSGRPVRISRSTLDHLFWQAFQLREHLWRERDLSGTFLSILRNDQRPPSTEGIHLTRLADWGVPVATVWPTGPSALLDYRASTSDLLAAIREISPDYICTFPSLLLEILRVARDENLAMPRVREVITVSEACPPGLRELCHEVLGAKMSSTYSAAECGGIATQCMEGNWHAQSERVVVEILDENGRPCAAGMTGRVILTPLQNFAMPLFRYEIGDLATVASAPPCKCGRKLPVIAKIPGRARDLLMLPSGEMRPAYYGHNAVMGVRSIRQHQVTQTSLENVCLRLVVANPLTAEEENFILSKVDAALEGRFGVSIEYVESIQRQPSGKYAEFERTFSP